jgi:2-polyprenyl-3-methyl-5-hydroxy-6-metoxy-1,4-benzoquinol methylase
MAINCPLCNSNSVKDKFNKQGLSYLKCSECRFTFLQNSDNPNFQNILDDFEGAYIDYLKASPADKKNHSSLLKWIRKYTTNVAPHILDVGSGSGKWINYLTQQGFVTFGLEPSVTLYNHFLANNNSFEFTTVNNYIRNNPEKKFDIITVFDVLEHIKDPVEFLSGIASLMHPASLLFISTPDISSLHRKLTGKRWHYFNKYHFSYFSKITLTQAADKAGLHLLHTSHRSRYFQMGYVWNYFKNFVVQKKSSSSTMQKGLLISLNLFDNMYCVLKRKDS